MRAALELTEIDDETKKPTGSFESAGQDGGHVWSVLCPAVVRGGRSYRRSVEDDFIHGHASYDARLAWDIPSNVVAGDRFTIKIGIKCSSECQFADSVCNPRPRRARVAAGVLSDDIWPGTAGLYFAEVELEGPIIRGPLPVERQMPAKDLARPHAEGAAEFGFRVVARPECLVKVEAVDRVSREPLAGASGHASLQGRRR